MKTRFYVATAAFVWLLHYPVAFAQPSEVQPRLNHNLNVTLTPDTSQIQVEDQIQRLGPLGLNSLKFKLQKGLDPSSLENNVRIVFLREEHAGENLILKEYEIIAPTKIKQVTLTYEGTIHHPERTETNPGTISQEGAMLYGSSYWYPTFENQNVTFEMTIKIPKHWRAFTQGNLTRKETHRNSSVEVWQSEQEQEAIYLLAAPFVYYSTTEGEFTTEVYLLSENAKLAGTYLKAAGEYIKSYSEMLGDYPYKKFSLIENFLPTGYGMPSFTVIGTDVIQLPFLVYTSYPHEILHNWWGNGVRVDYEHGNWCEGLTTFLADYFFQEQRGQGPEYRRSQLKAYTDYVNESNDIPLNKFLGRFDEASQAIGYGKAMMVFHMLKSQLGSSAFNQGLRDFYKNFLFKKASYEDLRSSFEAISYFDLERFFNQWVAHPGAPKLELASAELKQIESKLSPQETHYKLDFTVQQTQSHMVYSLVIPFRVHFENGQVFRENFVLSDVHQSYQFEFGARPKRLEIDPEMDVFRILDEREVPASFSKVFSEREKNYFILPSHEKTKESEIRSFLNDLQQQLNGPVEVLWDNELEDLPSDGSVYLLGLNNKLALMLQSELKKNQFFIEGPNIHLLQKTYPLHETQFVLTLSNSKNPKKGILWLGTDRYVKNPLTRKIFHYGKYSVTLFDQSGNNLVKDFWPTTQSPLAKEL